jgi:hypothetical protein
MRSCIVTAAVGLVALGLLAFGPGRASAQQVIVTPAYPPVVVTPAYPPVIVTPAYPPVVVAPAYPPPVVVAPAPVVVVPRHHHHVYVRPRVYVRVP